MFAKLSIVLLFVSVIYARQVSSSENVSDQVDDLLKKLEDAIDNAIAEAHKAIVNAKEAANKTAAQAQLATKNALKVIEKRYQDEVNDMKARAKRADVDADECFGQDESTLLSLPDIAAEQMVDCTNGYLLRVLNDADDALDKVQELADELLEVKQSVEKCKGDKICLAALAIKIEKDITTIPGEIRKDVEDVVDVLKNIEPEVKKCGTDAVDECERKGSKLLTKMSKCVDSKINS